MSEPAPSPVPDPGAGTALSRLASAPFVGRESQLETLRMGLLEALSGRARCFLLAGDPGIGKSRTAGELSHAASSLGMRVHTVRCHETEGAPAFWPWLAIARALIEERTTEQLRALAGADALARILPELRERIPELDAPTDASGAEQQFRVFEGFVSLIGAAARDTPRLLVVDDLHWADRVSLTLARFAIRELRDTPLMLVGTYREIEVAGDDALARGIGDLGSEGTFVQLLGLDQANVARFMEYVAGFPVPEVLAAAVQVQTGGNPLFLTEVARLLAAEDRFGSPDAPTPDPIPLPETVRQTLQRRIRGLPPSVRDALSRAAVIGVEFDADILERSGGASPGSISEAVDRACEARLVQALPDHASRFRFAHDLVRETLYDDLEPGQRARLHRDVGVAIEAVRDRVLERHFAELAHHFSRSASPDTARRAGDYAVRAGQEAARQFSFEEAGRQYQLGLRALEFAAVDAGSAEFDRRRCEVLIELGNVLWHAGDRDEAGKRHLSAAELAREISDSALLARAAIGLTGRTDIPMGFPDKASALLEEALDALPREDSLLRVRVLSNLVRGKYFGSDRSPLEAWAREAVAMAERLGDPRARFTALESLHYALFVPEAIEERLRIAEQLPDLAEDTRIGRFHALARIWRIVDLLEVPDIAGAGVELGRLEGIAREMRQPFHDWLTSAFRAALAQLEGRLDEAERLITLAFEHGRKAGSPNALILFGTQLFHLRAEQGRIAELAPVMRQIVDENPALPVFRVGVPLIHALCEQPAEARSAFEQVAARDFDDIPHDLNRLPMISSAAEICAYLGDTRRARLLVDELRRYEGRILVAGVGTYWAGPVDRFIALLEATLGDLDAALAHYETALEAMTRAGARLLAAHTQCELADVLRERSSAGDARRRAELLSEARATYEALGLEWRLERLARSDSPDGPSSAAIDGGRAPATPGPTTVHRFARAGDAWQITYAVQTVELPNSKGLEYLARLLDHADRELHVMELVSPAAPRASTPARTGSSLRVTRGGGAEEILDPRARADYRERLTALRGELDLAQQNCDLARAESAREEIGFLEGELTAALGLGGRARTASDPVERARKSVYNRIRAGLRRIEAVHPELGRHLRRAIRTGTYCAYQPERETTWIVGS